MLKVGLTGGIASGKSTVAAEFNRLGVPLVDADALSKEMTAPGSAGLRELVAALGREILDADGQLHRARLRRRLFVDAALRAQVENILHPLVIRGLKEALDKFKTAYAVAVVPLLAEHPEARTLVNRVLVVDCPESTQVARLMLRDGESPESARDILSTQASRARRLAAGDDILMNTGGVTELAGFVAKLHRLYVDITEHPIPKRMDLCRS